MARFVEPTSATGSMRPSLGAGSRPPPWRWHATTLTPLLGLHRIEIAMRPENQASRRVVEKLGFRFEGTRPAFFTLTVSGATTWSTPFIETKPRRESCLRLKQPRVSVVVSHLPGGHRTRDTPSSVTGK